MSTLSTATHRSRAKGDARARQASRMRVVLVAGGLLVGLLAAGVAWVDRGGLWALPSELGPIPIGVPYFGALGGLMCSLDGALRDHRTDWDQSFEAWHHFRVVLGALAGTIVVLVFLAGILGAGLSTTAAEGRTEDLAFLLFAFVAGYRERIFFELLQRLADVVLTTAARPPSIREIRPAHGPAAGGQPVHLVGAGFDGADAVLFGDEQADILKRTDTLIVVLAPARAAGAGDVAVSVAADAGTASATYSYT